MAPGAGDRPGGFLDIRQKLTPNNKNSGVGGLLFGGYSGEGITHIPHIWVLGEVFRITQRLECSSVLGSIF